MQNPRPVRLLLLAAAASMVLLCSCSTADDPVRVDEQRVAMRAASAAPVEKEWTFLLYDGADSPGGMYDALLDFAAAPYVCSSAKVNALVLQDTYGGPTRLWSVSENHEPILLADYGELNMGGMETLRDFVLYAKANYPAKRYIVSFYGHGSVWRGACFDGTDQDVLTMQEMHDALHAANGVDIMMFSAPCNMATVEGIYEVRDVADVYIASENLSGYMFWMYSISDIFRKMNEDPNDPTRQFAGYVIEQVWKHRNEWAFWGLKKGLTMSAVSTDRIEALVEAVDDVALAYLAEPEKFLSHVAAISRKCDRFYYSYVVDLACLMRELRKIETDPAIVVKLEHVLWCLDDAVIAGCESMPKLKEAESLNIFVPYATSARTMGQYVDPIYGLDFVTDTHWDELVSLMMPPAVAAR